MTAAVLSQTATRFLRRSSDPIAGGAAAAAPAPAGAAARVLIVEDQDDARRALSMLCRKRGFAIAAAPTLAEALRSLDDWRPDAILLDLMLPDGNGVEVLRRVRGQRLAVRVAVVTAVFGGAELQEVRALGPDALFQKPVDFSVICHWLERP